MRVDMPGRDTSQLEHLVPDLNGTIVLDGELLPGAGELLAALSGNLTTHLVTANTHGRAEEIAAQLEVRLARIEARDEAGRKRALWTG